MSKWCIQNAAGLKNLEFGREMTGERNMGVLSMDEARRPHEMTFKYLHSGLPEVSLQAALS
jgi:hypothetical protein